MNVHARISKEWRRRMILMALMINGSALWFCYDGFIAWPAEARRYEQLELVAADILPAAGKHSANDPAVERAWADYAAEHNLNAKVPKKRTPGDIGGQRLIGEIALAIGLAFVGWVALQHRKSVRADGDIITGASGEKVHLDTIVEMDRHKWANKGIAYAIYEADGKRRRLCLDDHKFIGCEAIILEAERRIAARATPASATQ
ncbi:MAG: hypothetical protein WC205_01575 [Opitutaceae bacterium]|jgi:hypothetical protein